MVGAFYGVLIFVAGFVFGAIRELVLIPSFGGTAGRLIEFPLMLLAVAVIARMLVRRTCPGSAVRVRLAVGMVGVIVLVGIESTFALAVMGVLMSDYLAGYDVTRGALFPLGLLWLAAAPTAVGRH